MSALHYSFAFIIALCTVTQAQNEYSLSDLHRMAKEHHPLAKQKQISQQHSQLTLDNLEKQLLPVITIFGQASYQSTVTGLPLVIPGKDIPLISRDQYRLYAELNQVIYDGGLVHATKEVSKADALAEEVKADVDLYTVLEKVNQHFFRILLTRGQLRQAELTEKDLLSELKKREAGIAAGVTLKSVAAQLKAEVLRVQQKKLELRSTESADLAMLSHLTGKTLSPGTVLTEPRDEQVNSTISRPELLYFDQRIRVAQLQKETMNGRAKPKVSVFLQGGVGRPALNMLSNEFEPYYIGGLRLNWSINGLYTLKKDKALAEVSASRMSLQKESFVFSIDNAILQQDSEEQKLRQLLESDEEIIALRNEIKRTASAQLENGVISTTDYLHEVTASDQAAENRLLHHIQLLMLQQQKKIITGNVQ